MDLSPLETLQTFFAQLLHRHRQIHQHQDEDLSLIYADALLRNEAVHPHLDDFPQQIVVIGPTQAGKSTVVNLLLGSETAASSPLAGFTRHAQGFPGETLSDPLVAGTDGLLAGLERTDCTDLNAEQLDQYCLKDQPASDPFNASVVIWDTPDFDSVSSRTYRSTVPMLCAIANLIVLVVSKDKYADQSVWETLRLIGQINRPLLVCVNKIAADSSEQFIDIVTEKFSDENIPYQKIVTLPYLNNAAFSDLLSTDGAKILRTECLDSIKNTTANLNNSHTDSSSLKTYLENNWDQWVRPLHKEQSAQQQWEIIVQACINEGKSIYEIDYLENPHFSDTLQKAINRLLELLEIPGMGKSLARARQAITWPARTIAGFFKKQPSTPGESRTLDTESQALLDSTQHILLQLLRKAGEHAASADDDSRLWWQQLWQELQNQQEILDEQTTDNIDQHQVNFRPDINEAAERLYQHLKKHPVKLNALRTTRVTADAAAVLVALKTGGIGLNDLVLAPAMLSFTSMLTEGAVGQYMNHIEKELKQKQLESVQTHVYSKLQKALGFIPETMDQSDLYAISREETESAETAIGHLS